MVRVVAQVSAVPEADIAVAREETAALRVLAIVAGVMVALLVLAIVAGALKVTGPSAA